MNTYTVWQKAFDKWEADEVRANSFNVVDGALYLFANGEAVACYAAGEWSNLRLDEPEDDEEPAFDPESIAAKVEEIVQHVEVYNGRHARWEIRYEPKEPGIQFVKDETMEAMALKYDNVTKNEDGSFTFEDCEIQPGDIHPGSW